MFNSKYLAGLALAAGCLLASQASAATVLTLEDPAPVVVQDAGQGHCIIAYGGTCQTTMWDFYNLNDLPGGAGSVSSYDVTSPEYTVSQIADAVSDLFVIGVDMNNTGSAQTFDFFHVMVDGMVEFIFDGDWTGKAQANGTGTADLMLSYVDLSSFGDDQIVTFRAAMSDQNDGFEQFFLHSACVVDSSILGCDGGGTGEVPIPGTLPLLASGVMLGVIGMRRRRTS